MAATGRRRGAGGDREALGRARRPRRGGSSSTCSAGRLAEHARRASATVERRLAVLARRRCGRPRRPARGPSPAGRSRCRAPGCRARAGAGRAAGAPGAYTEAGPPESTSPAGWRRLDLLRRRVVRDDRREDAALADAARDELAVLRAEVDHQDAARRRGGERRVEAPACGRWSSRRSGYGGGRTDRQRHSPGLLAVSVALAAARTWLGWRDARDPLPRQRVRRASSAAARRAPARTSAPAPAGRIQSSSSPRSACAERPPTVATCARTVISLPITRTRSAPSDQLAAQPAARLEADDQDGGRPGRRGPPAGGAGCARRRASPSPRSRWPAPATR